MIDSSTQTDNAEMCDASTQILPEETSGVTGAVSLSVSSYSQTTLDDPDDLSYQPSYSESSQQSSQQSVPSVVDPITDRKFLVFEGQLDQLFRLLTCPLCSCPISIDDIVKTSNEGTLLHVIAFCTGGHVIINWRSQPMIGRMPVGNLLTCAATLLSGQTFQHIHNIFQLLGMKFLSHVPFYNLQRTNFTPVIVNTWKEYQQSMFSALRNEGKPLRVCGDGRMDSPGFSAKYCTYSLMDMETDQILVFAVVNVTEAGGSSTNMEVLGLERCLNELYDNGLTVEMIATDRHVQVRSFLKKKFPFVVHQFDVWHLAKSIRKKLHNVSRKRLNSDLSAWNQSITNHLWWCAANCQGDPDLLEESWGSITHHIVNVHEFPGQSYTQCAHPLLSDDEQRRKKWLQPNSPAHNALKEIVLNKALLKDIRQLNYFCHTGNLEVFHSLMTKYCPKRQEFDWTQMLARTVLVVLDHNNNTKRPLKVNNVGDICYKVAYSKATAKWVAKPQYENKNTDHFQELMHRIVRQQECHTLRPLNTDCPQNIAPTPAPSRNELLSRQRSRFSIE